jgi:hypothetical protein
MVLVAVVVRMKGMHMCLCVYMKVQSGGQRLHALLSACREGGGDCGYIRRCGTAFYLDCCCCYYCCISAAAVCLQCMTSAGTLYSYAQPLQSGERPRSLGGKCAIFNESTERGQRLHALLSACREGGGAVVTYAAATLHSI